MNESFDHLAPECRDEARLGTAERIRAILTERWINYPRAGLALQRLEHLLHHPARDRMPCLLLFGPTGMGKTKILRKFIRDHPALFNSKTGINGMPLVAMQMPPDPDEKAFYLQLLSALNAPTRYSHTVYQLRQIVAELLAFTQTRMIIIDRALLTDQQLADRFEAAELQPWRNDADFKRLLASFQALLPLRKRSDLSTADIRQEIIRRTEGITVRIVRLLEHLAIHSIHSGLEAITLECFVVLDSQAPLLSMETHARSIE